MVSPYSVRSQWTPSVALVAVVGSALAVLMTGCSGRALAPNAADGLRAELVERTRERDAARARMLELETKVGELSQSRDRKIDPEVAEAMPALASVSLSSQSAGRLTDPNHATLATVIAPFDGLGRFIQITGTLRLSVAALVPGRDPLPAGSLTVGPKALRDAYRAGFLGSHYTIEVPLKWDGAESPRALAVSAEFTDGLTGKAYPCGGTVPVIARAVAPTTDAAIPAAAPATTPSPASAPATSATPAAPR